MVRKRGRSRLSSAVKRIQRWKNKYVVDALTKRPKILLPTWLLYAEYEWTEWDFVETTLFPEFEELGIPEWEWAYYMAWAKRRVVKGLRFSGTSLEEEWAILDDEFVTRGLDSSNLEALDSFIRYIVDVKSPKLSFVEHWEYGNPPTFILQHSEAWSS